MKKYKLIKKDNKQKWISCSFNVGDILERVSENPTSDGSYLYVNTSTKSDYAQWIPDEFLEPLMDTEYYFTTKCTEEDFLNAFEEFLKTTTEVFRSPYDVIYRKDFNYNYYGFSPTKELNEILNKHNNKKPLDRSKVIEKLERILERDYAHDTRLAYLLHDIKNGKFDESGE